MLDNIYYKARASGRISPHGGRVTVAIKLDIEGYECRAIFGSPGKSKPFATKVKKTSS